MCDALNKIYSGEFESNNEYAIKKISELMSREAVKNKFMEIIMEEFEKGEGGASEEKNSKSLLTVANYNKKTNKFDINGNIYGRLKVKNIKSEWLIINNGFNFSRKIVEDLIEKNDGNEIILLRTKYDDSIYPTIEDINNARIDINRMNYCIKSKYLSGIKSNVKNSDIKNVLFVKFMNKLKVALSDNIVCY